MKITNMVKVQSKNWILMRLLSYAPKIRQYRKFDQISDMQRTDFMSTVPLQFMRFASCYPSDAEGIMLDLHCTVVSVF